MFSGLGSAEVRSWFSAWLEAIGRERHGWYFLPKSKIYSTAKVQKLFLSYPESAQQIMMQVCVHTSICILRRFLAEEGLTDHGGLVELELHRFQAGAAILSHMEQVSSGIFDSVLRDNDVAARILARSFAEATDFLIMVLIDDAACEKFVEREANFREVFHAHFSRKKLVSARKRALTECFGLEHSYAHLFALSYQDELDVFSQYVHPSYDVGVTEILYSDLVLRERGGEWDFLHDWRAARTMELYRHSSLPSLMLAAAYFSANATFAGRGTLGERVVTKPLMEVCKKGLFDAANFFL